MQLASAEYGDYLGLQTWCYCTVNSTGSILSVENVVWGRLVTGDYITPQFNAQPRFDKPILIYWLMALSVEASPFFR